MAIISISSAFSAPKRRPKRYKAKDAPYPVGGNRGHYIASLPRPYPKNRPQRIIAELAKLCNIKAGMGKSELMTQMKGCVNRDNYKKASGSV